jgi:hypothetical protein
LTDELIAFKGEVMLLSWAESHKGGRTGVFLFDDESEQHPLKSFTTKRGKRAGTRFAMVLVEIAEDETPVQQEKKGGPLSKSAALMCDYPPFQQFMLERWEPNTPAPSNAIELAAHGIRKWCGINSRAELDHDEGAAQKFRDLMKGFNHWRGL